jgi:CheY-like chemotaxis protein
MHCRKILVVEDDEDIRSGLIEVLAFEGYEAVAAQNGMEAFELLRNREENPCLMLTDLTMPKMGGWELINLLAAHKPAFNFPIVIMTASEDRETHVNVKQTIRKPFDFNVLIKMLQKHCGNPNEGAVLEKQTFL